MNIGRVFKLVSAFSLSVILLLANFNLSALSQNISYVLIEESTDNFVDPLIYSESETSGDGISFFGIMPEISEAREVKWIDRIHNKPQYAVDFYDWLVENETTNGALVSAHEQTVTDKEGNSYQVHKVTSFSDEIYLDFTPGISSDEALSLLYKQRDEQFSETIDDDFYTVAEWTSEVYSAFDRDHPEVFWLSGGTVISHKTKYTYGYNLAYGIGYVKYVQDIYFRLHDDDFDIRSSAYCSHSHSNVLTNCGEACNSIKSAINETNTAVDNILASVTATTDLDKVKYINNYLTKNNYYNPYADTDIYSPLAHRCVSALLGKTGIYSPVCDGYAKAFKVLCDKMNIPCILVDGLSDGKEHMWNYVQIDGVWYAVDVTWNDPIISKNVAASGYENEKYLLVGNDCVIDGEKFSDTHIVHNVVTDGGISFINEPIISRVSYNTKVPHICELKADICTFCYAKKFDANRDGEIDMSDLVAMQNVLFNDSKNGNCDFNGDGIINSYDYIVLRKYFWEMF